MPRGVRSENSARRGELGGACCAYHHGEKVVDLWGGIRNRADGRAVGAGHDGHRPLGHERTGSHDAGTRPLPRLSRLRRSGGHVLARVRSAGRRRLSPSASSWRTRRDTVAFDEPVDRDVGWPSSIASRWYWPVEKPGMRARARARPTHALTLGFYEGELMRRVDPRHRSLGQFFQDEVASPLGEDVYIRLAQRRCSELLASRPCRRRAGSAC